MLIFKKTFSEVYNRFFTKCKEKGDNLLNKPKKLEILKVDNFKPSHYYFVCNISNLIKRLKG
jgi:hypothetical protein